MLEKFNMVIYNITENDPADAKITHLELEVLVNHG